MSVAPGVTMASTRKLVAVVEIAGDFGGKAQERAFGQAAGQADRPVVDLGDRVAFADGSGRGCPPALQLRQAERRRIIAARDLRRRRFHARGRKTDRRDQRSSLVLPCAHSSSPLIATASCGDVHASTRAGRIDGCRPGDVPACAGNDHWVAPQTSPREPAPRRRIPQRWSLSCKDTFAARMRNLSDGRRARSCDDREIRRSWPLGSERIFSI